MLSKLKQSFGKACSKQNNVSAPLCFIGD